MFNTTKYSRWYHNIIFNARQHDRCKHKGEYYESHHIIPRSLGGTDVGSNLVLLTAREHYVCHLLLPKMCISSDHKRRMVFALMQLSEAANKYRVDNQHNSKLYEHFKQHYVKLISGPNCYMYGVPKTPEQRAKISKTRKEKGLARKENNPMFGKNTPLNQSRRCQKLNTNEFKNEVVQKLAEWPYCWQIQKVVKFEPKMVEPFHRYQRLLEYTGSLMLALEEGESRKAFGTMFDLHRPIYQ